MSLTLEMSGDVYDELLGHLFQGEEENVEQAAFLFTEPYSGDGVLRIAALHKVPTQDFEIQSGFHIHLADHVRQELIMRAWSEDACLVEVHSHDDEGRVHFSKSDLIGLDDWVPHVRWRLRGRPYVALVFGHQRFDGLCWTDAAEEPKPIELLAIDGRPPLSPTGRTYERLVGERDQR